MSAQTAILAFSVVILLDPHQCNCLVQTPRSRREFVVESVASIASTTLAGASFPSLSVANEDVASTSKQLALPPIGIGAWAWGDSIFWGYDKKVYHL